MLQAKLSDPIMIGLWARSADNGFDHAVMGITTCLLLDPNIPLYSSFCFQPCMGCLNPSWLTSILSPSFFSVLPLLIWPVGFPPPLLLSWAITLMLLTLAPLAPSSPFRAARLPWGSKVICAVSSPWGSKVICCSPYGTIVLDSLWLTSLSLPT